VIGRTKKDIVASVVIPSYRPGEGIFRCLNSITHQNVDISFEIIVVDSSPKDLGDEIKAVFPEVQVIHLKQRTLPGRARSLGASMAKGEIVFFTDSDCVVHKNWIKELCKIHQTGYPVAGGSVVNGTPKSVVGTAEYLLEFNEINPWAKPREVRALPSCNFSVNKRIFEAVGFFPDFMKGEDTIFCERVVSLGERIFFHPKAKIVHENRKKLVFYLKNQIALGEGALETRRRTKRHGHFLVNYPFFIPLVPVYRTLIIGKRLLKSHPRLFFSYLFHYPLIFLGLLVYTWGFIRGPYRSGLSTEPAR